MIETNQSSKKGCYYLQDILNSPLFGILLSLIAFEIGYFIYRKTKIVFFNPLMVAIVIVIVFLKVFGIPYESYIKGGSMISFFLGPATVILAVPLYKQIDQLKNNTASIFAGIISGSLSAVLGIYISGKLFKLDNQLIMSLIPKSITTPIGIELSSQLGGIPSITVAAIVITGIVGAVMGPAFCRITGIKDSVAVGVAIGTSAHALGTTKAIEIGEVEGAMSGLSIGIAGIVTVIISVILF